MLTGDRSELAVGGVAEPHRREADGIPAVALAPHVAARGQREQQPVGGALGQADPPRDLGHTQRPLSRREGLQDVQGAVDGLDTLGPGRLTAHDTGA